MSRICFAVVDLVGEADLGADLDVDVDRERDLRRRPAVDRHAPDLATVRDHDRARVGREGVARQHVDGGARLLVVALDRVDEPPLLAALDVADAEPRLRLVPRPVREPPTVGRDGGPEPRAETRRHRRLHPRLPVVHAELVLREDRVVAPVPLPRGVPDVARVAPERRAEHLELRDLRRRTLAGGLDERLARAALSVEQPELRRAPESAAARRDDVLAIGRPLRRDVEVVVPLRHLDRVLPVERHDPDVVAARAVGDEDDALAVWAEARLDVVRHPAR
jgi:hypothetical protein